MEKWIHENLSKILNFPATDDLTKLETAKTIYVFLWNQASKLKCIWFFRYIMAIQNERDLDEYLKSLLDYSNPMHRQFIAEIKKRQGI